MNCKMSLPHSVFKCEQSDLHLTMSHHIMIFSLSKRAMDLSIKDPRAQTPVHYTDSTPGHGDIINNVDYTIKHRGTGKERKQ